MSIPVTIFEDVVNSSRSRCFLEGNALTSRIRNKNDVIDFSCLFAVSFTSYRLRLSSENK
jgi:hypothetical protein